jgi:AraC-like DNA-binding protein
MLRGRACFAVDGTPPAWLAAGDVALLRGPDHYLFADDPARRHKRSSTPASAARPPTVRTSRRCGRSGYAAVGNASGGATEILIGTYNLESEVSRRLLDALPPQLVLRGDEWQTPVLGLLADEIPRGDVGQDAVLDRLLDLLLIHAVRAYFTRGASEAPGWFRAQDDPVVGHAVRLLQENPAEAWTLASLARETRVSRATLARRFTRVVGQPPMEYLTEWRLTLAADLILDSAETLGSVAGKVGYGSAYALSAAFKRVRGVRPGYYRSAERLRARSA